MGEVFLGEDQKLQRQVALKFLDLWGESNYPFPEIEDAHKQIKLLTSST